MRRVRQIAGLVGLLGCLAVPCQGADSILPEPPNAWKPVGSDVTLKDFATGEVIAADRLVRDAYLGVQVRHCIYGSPAWRAGIKGGDIILGVGGERVADPRELYYAFSLFPEILVEERVSWKYQKEYGRSAPLTVLRQGRLGTCQLTLLTSHLEADQSYGFQFQSRGPVWCALMQKVGASVAAEDLPIVEYLSGRFVALANKWAEINPEAVKQATWVSDVHQLFVDTCRQKFKDARPPRTAVPFPFGAYFAGACHRVAQHMVAGGNPLDEKAVDMSDAHFCAYYPLPWFQETPLPLGPARFTRQDFAGLLRARLEDPMGSVDARWQYICNHWQRRNGRTPEGLDELNMIALIAPAWASVRHDIHIPLRASGKPLQSLAIPVAELAVMPDAVLLIMRELETEILPGSGDSIKAYHALYEVSPFCARELYIQEDHRLDDKLRKELAPILLKTVAEGSPFFGEVIRTNPAVLECVEDPAPSDAYGSDAQRLCRYLQIWPRAIRTLGRPKPASWKTSGED